MPLQVMPQKFSSIQSEHIMNPHGHVQQKGCSVPHRAHTYRAGRRMRRAGFGSASFSEGDVAPSCPGNTVEAVKRHFSSCWGTKDVHRHARTNLHGTLPHGAPAPGAHSTRAGRPGSKDVELSPTGRLVFLWGRPSLTPIAPLISTGQGPGRRGAEVVFSRDAALAAHRQVVQRDEDIGHGANPLNTVVGG